MGNAGGINKRAGGKRVCGRFRSLSDHEDVEDFYDGDDGQRRGANKRRSHGICQRIGFIRDGDAS